MEILGDLLSAGASAMSGGLFGLIGNVAAKAFGYVEADQSARHRQAEWEHEIELLKLQQPGHPEGSEHAPAIDMLAPLETSLRAEAAIPSSYEWVNAVRALVRPALTLGLAGFLSAAFFFLPESAAEKAYVADSLVFASVTAIVWWFGDRAPKRQLRH